MEYAGGGFHRFPPSGMSDRYVRGKKKTTHGKLYLVCGNAWKQYNAGNVSNVRLYQNCSVTPALTLSL